MRENAPNKRPTMMNGDSVSAPSASHKMVGGYHDDTHKHN